MSEQAILDFRTQQGFARQGTEIKAAISHKIDQLLRPEYFRTLDAIQKLLQGKDAQDMTVFLTTLLDTQSRLSIEGVHIKLLVEKAVTVNNEIRDLSLHGKNMVDTTLYVLDTKQLVYYGFAHE